MVKKYIIHVSLSLKKALKFACGVGVRRRGRCRGTWNQKAGCNSRCGQGWLLRHGVNRGGTEVFEVCVFCVFYTAQVSWVQFLHSPRVSHMWNCALTHAKFTLSSTCALRYQSRWNKFTFSKQELQQNWLYRRDKPEANETGLPTGHRWEWGRKNGGWEGGSRVKAAWHFSEYIFGEL